MNFHEPKASKHVQSADILTSLGLDSPRTFFTLFLCVLVGLAPFRRLAGRILSSLESCLILIGQNLLALLLLLEALIPVLVTDPVRHSSDSVNSHPGIPVLVLVATAAGYITVPQVRIEVRRL